MSHRAQGPESTKISVVVPLYNKATLVRRALDSVCAQTVRELEVIVVNDGSTDGGQAVARAFPDTRVRVVDQSNLGVGAARNTGIREARGELVTFLDADDAWEPDFIATILSLRNAYPQAGVLATGYFVHQGEQVRATIVRGLPPGFERGLIPEYFRVAAHSDPPFNASSIVVTRPAIQAVDGFPVGVSSGEDLLTWARLAAQNDIAYCRTPKSHFFAPESVKSRPGRLPQEPDLVAAGLRRLAEEFGGSSRLAGIEEYLGTWCTMRGLVYIELAQRRRALSAMRQAFQWSPGGRTAALYLLALGPGPLTARVLKGARSLLWSVRQRRALEPGRGASAP